ncbi:uncharacterized protein LOC144124951 [Amblyomma americanum]
MGGSMTTFDTDADKWQQHVMRIEDELALELLRTAEHMRECYAVTGFPQAIGALDGCHFAISPPKKDAAGYYNYKGWHSTILLAIVDHQYRFLYLNVGSPGRCHDAHVYGRSKLKRIVDTLFNYNLSTSRRIVENAFVRVKARFRFIMKRIECKPSNAKQATKASCTLHNICEAFRDNVDEEWVEDMHTFNALYQQPSHNSDACTGDGQDVRAPLAEYFWKRAQ